MASVVDICNQALALVRAEPIVSLDDRAESARQCKLWYPQSRDEVLAAHPWNEAAARAVLPALAAAPAFGYAFAYRLPADCLAVRGIWQEPEARWVLRRAGEARGVRGIWQEPEARWEIEGGALVTDVPAPLCLHYTRRQDDPAVFGPLLTAAIVRRLAAAVAPKLIENRAAVLDLRQDYEDALRVARRTDAQQSPPEDASWTGGWLEARVSGDVPRF